MPISRKIESMYQGFEATHKKQKIWQRVVTILSCFVVFCTTYALILPAITMETTTDPNAIFCGNVAHIHSEECYDGNGSLICASEEHEHTLACYSNPDADVENEAYWKKLASELNIASVWSSDLVNVAVSQKSYRESDRNYQILEDGSRRGYTRFGAWDKDPYGEWNAAFVGWSLKYAGIDEKYIPYSSDYNKWITLLSQKNLFAKADYTPKKGDIAFWDTNEDGIADRVGIIADIITDLSGSAPKLILSVLEGDKDNAVAQTQYKKAELDICGYAQLAPAYKQYLDDNGLSDPKEYDVPIYTDKYYTNLSKDKTEITIEGVLPLDAEPRAYPVDVSMKGHDVVCSYDITIWLSDGTIYEPEQYVTVSIKQSDIPSSSAVYYVPEEGEPEKMTSRPQNAGVSFDAGHFSVYAVVGTTPEKVDGLNEKPTSGAATGSIKNFVTDISEIRGKYYSDKVTANIESKFAGIINDDGRLLTDKSVLYNNNDYYTFNNYGTDEFSVTLSALAQQYAESYKVADKSPVDVVMILDISGSMENVGTSARKRIDIATEAVNYFINNLMLLHPENRVGIVVFANNSQVMLPLGRYYVGSGTPSYSDEGTIPSYIVCTSGACTVSNSSYSGIATNSSLKKVTTDGKGNYVSSSSVSQVKFGDYGGTFTQSGIARAAEMFLNETNLTYTATTGDVLKRMPVTLLLSDGEPTFCTSDYTDVFNGTLHGSGIGSDTTNPKGVQGYYTVLSANHYKQQITNHYKFKDEDGNNASYFYSIGMGINATGVTAAGSGTVSGDHYKRAVLNPSASEIALLTDTSANNYSINAYQLYQLLRSEYSGSSITVGATSYNASTSNGYTVIGSPSSPTSSVPVVKNPYSNYAYADKAFFSSDYTVSELEEVMDAIMVNMINNETYVKSFFDSVSNISFYDEIGSGMQISSDFILRYNGLDYAMSLVSSEGNTKKYQYTGTASVKPYYGSPEAYPLSDITVEVATASDGTQTLRWFIPEKLVPELGYCQGMTITDYYQMYPVRLIYKVGLTDSSKELIADLKEGDAPLVFYTNAWGSTQTTVQFHANEKNPYYKNFAALSETKENNVTGTRETYYESRGTFNVTDILGNNGKLVFEYKNVVPDTEGEKTNFKVNKVWSDGNEKHSNESITMNLLADGTIYSSATLNEANDWNYIWENIPKYYTNGEEIEYIVKENKVLGYQSLIGTPQAGTFVKSYSWKNISSFSSGVTVRIVYNNQALANTSGSTVSMVALDDSDETQQWIVASSGSNYTLKNVSTGRYLYASSSSGSYTVSTSTSTHNWTIRTSGNNLLLRSSSLSRNLRINDSGISLNSSGTAIQPQSLDAVTLSGTEITVTNNKLEAAETTKLTIKKEWLNADGTPDLSGSHQDVTVTLFADGEEYSVVTLSVANDWKATIHTLPVAWSLTPDTPIAWTFKESAVDGYLSVFGELEKTTATDTAFVTESNFAEGEIFWITDANGNALTAAGSSLGYATKDESDKYQQWKAENNSNGYYLKNVGTNTYLYVSRSGNWNNYTYSLGLSSSTQRWSYSNNKLQNRSYTSYYLALESGNPNVTTSGTEVTIGQYENTTVNIWTLPLTNRAGVELPSTGGNILLIYILCGLVFLTVCLICGLISRKKPCEGRHGR